MASKRKPKPDSQQSNINANFSGNISGQVAIGTGIQQTQTVHSVESNLSAEDIKVLFDLFSALKDQVSNKAPEAQRDAAFDKVSELEEAITSKEPDISTMEHVRNWFVKNIPQLAGAVTGLIVNPIVGKLAEAAGETVVLEFKRRFGG